MPEGTYGYPKWFGQLQTFSRFGVIAMQEVRRGWYNQWSRLALTFAFGYGIVSLGALYSVSQNRPDVHSMDAFVDFLNLLRWVALAVAAVMAGPALLEDARKGALELYLSRAVTRADYLTGKILAVVLVTFVTMAGPALVYYLGSFLVFDGHPEAWRWAWAGALGYALLWSLVVSGLGLGLSCIARSSRAASVILFGGIAGVDIVLGELLQMITRNSTFQVLSPMSDLERQTTWLLPGSSAAYDFPEWWGLLVLGGLLAVGWGLVAWRHPRLKGVE